MRACNLACVCVCVYIVRAVNKSEARVKYGALLLTVCDSRARIERIDYATIHVTGWMFRVVGVVARQRCRHRVLHDVWSATSNTERCVISEVDHNEQLFVYNKRQTFRVFMFVTFLEESSYFMRLFCDSETSRRWSREDTIRNSEQINRAQLFALWRHGINASREFSPSCHQNVSLEKNARFFFYIFFTLIYYFYIFSYQLYNIYYHLYEYVN